MERINDSNKIFEKLLDTALNVHYKDFQWQLEFENHNVFAFMKDFVDEDLKWENSEINLTYFQRQNLWVSKLGWFDLWDLFDKIETSYRFYGFEPEWVNEVFPSFDFCDSSFELLFNLALNSHDKSDVIIHPYEKYIVDIFFERNEYEEKLSFDVRNKVASVRQLSTDKMLKEIK